MAVAGSDWGWNGRRTGVLSCERHDSGTRTAERTTPRSGRDRDRARGRRQTPRRDGKRGSTAHDRSHRLRRRRTGNRGHRGDRRRRGSRRAHARPDESAARSGFRSATVRRPSLGLTSGLLAGRPPDGSSTESSLPAEPSQLDGFACAGPPPFAGTPAELEGRAKQCPASESSETDIEHEVPADVADADACHASPLIAGVPAAGDTTRSADALLHADIRSHCHDDPATSEVEETATSSEPDVTAQTAEPSVEVAARFRRSVGRSRPGRPLTFRPSRPSRSDRPARRGSGRATG